MGVNGNDDDEWLPDVPRPSSASSVNALGDDSFGLADLARLERQYANEPAVYREMRMRNKRAREEIEAINMIESKMPGSINDPKLPWKKRLATNMRTRANLKPRMALHQRTTREHLNQQAVNEIGRSFSESAVNSYIHSNSNSLEAQAAGAGLATEGYNSLAAQRSGLMGQIHQLRGQSMEAANSYIVKGGVNADSAGVIEKNAAHMKDMAQQLIPITLAMQQLKQQGLDPQGRQRALIGTGDKAAAYLGRERLEQEMKSGQGLGAFSPMELKKKETEAAEKLIKALEELRNSAGKTSQELEGMNENAEKAAKEFEDIQDARGMSGGGGNKYESAKIIAGTIGEALGMISSAYSNVAINQPMQMVYNTANAANMENEKYNMWHSAVAGDMTARMSLGAWGVGAQFGDQLANSQRNVHIMNIAQSGTAAVVGGLQVGEAVIGLGGEAVGISATENASRGAKGLIGGAAGMIQEGLAWNRETEMARLRVDGTRAVVGAAQAINYIPGRQLQTYRDYVMGQNQAAKQMGGFDGEDFLNDTTGGAFLSRMEQAGIGAKEMSALSMSGATVMGSMFNRNQVLTAVDLERSGFGTAQQNMQRMGTIGAAGIGDAGANLSKIIEEGMQRGLNSSKAIDLIVENTARMTEQTVMAGGNADPTEFITKTILSAIDRNNPNKEMAAKIAYQTYQTSEGARHNIAASFPGIINVDRNMRAMGLGTDRLSASLLTQIPTHVLNAYKRKEGQSAEDAESKLRAFLESQGINVQNMNPNLFKDDQAINILNETGSVAELAGQSGIGYVAGAPGEIVAAMKRLQNDPVALNAFISGKDPGSLSAADRKLRQNWAGGHKISTGTDPAFALANAAANIGISVPNKTKISLAEMKAQNESMGAATDDQRLGGRAEAGQMKAGADLLGSGSTGKNAILQIAASGQEAFKSAGVNAEARWGEAASNTAAAFGKSAMNLDTSTGHLNGAAANLLGATDAMKVVSESFQAVVRRTTEELEKRTGKIVQKLDAVLDKVEGKVKP